MPDRSALLHSHIGQATMGILVARKGQLLAAGAKGGHRNTGIIMAINKDFVIQLNTKRIKKTDAGIG